LGGTGQARGRHPDSGRPRSGHQSGSPACWRCFPDRIRCEGGLRGARPGPALLPCRRRTGPI